MVRVIRVIRMIRAVAPPGATPVVAVTAAAVAGTVGDRRTLARRRNDAPASQVGAAHAATLGIVDRPLALARQEAVVIGAAPVPEDEAWLGTQRPCEHHPGAAVVAVRVVIGVVEDDDAEAHARVRIRIPVGPAGVRVAVVAEEAGVVVVPLHIIRHHVVIPVRVVRREDAPGEVGERDVGVAADAPVGDHAVVPVVARLDRVVDERVGGGDGEQVAHAGVIVHGEGVARGVALDFELLPPAHEVVLPRIAREQHAHAAVGVDAEQGDVGVLVRPDVDARAVAAEEGVVALRGPDLDAGLVIAGWPDGRRSRRPGDRGSEQRDVSQHGSS